jgi:hypothetical protein
VRGDPHRLVHDDDVIVVVDDAHARDGLGHDLRRQRGCRQVNVEPCSRGDPVGLDRRRPVDKHRAGGYEVSRLGAREAEEPGKGRVDALPCKTVGDGQASTVGHSAEYAVRDQIAD